MARWLSATSMVQPSEGQTLPMDIRTSQEHLEPAAACARPGCRLGRVQLCSPHREEGPG